MAQSATENPGRLPWVRVNAVTTPYWADDLAALSEGAAIAGIVLAKTEGAHEVDATSARLPADTPVVALVESAAGLQASATIAAHPATVRLAFGSGDFRRDTGIGDTPMMLAYPRCHLAVASRTAGLPGPIDGPTRAADRHLLRQETRDAVLAGMTGRLCLRPEQAADVNELLSPSSAELDWATETIARPAGNDPSAVPRVAQAEKIIERAYIFRGAVSRR